MANFKVAVSGATGLVGQALTAFLIARGYDVFKLTRSKKEKSSRAIFWDPSARYIDLETLSQMNAVVHLAGESIFGIWTRAKMKRIFDSRVEGTKFLVESLLRCSPRPQTFISTSAIGYYGDHGNKTIDESYSVGNTFLANVCQRWEDEAFKAEAGQIRTTALRLGMVLSSYGGALKQMLGPFRWGLGGRIGSGEQYVSWIHIEDLMNLFHEALINPSFSGPINAVSPTAVTNREFTQVLSRTLNRPTLLPMPAPLVKLLLGKMGEELLLTSARVIPQKAQDFNFKFTYPNLHEALVDLIP